MDINELKNIIKQEGDYFEFESYSLKCYGKRNHIGSWCGYIEIPPSHNAYEELINRDGDDYYGNYVVNMYGGVTFLEEEGGHITIGFDCAHSSDICPQTYFLHSEIYRIRSGSTYKDKNFVEEELKNTALKLHNIHPGYHFSKERDKLINDVISEEE